MLCGMFVFEFTEKLFLKPPMCEGLPTRIHALAFFEVSPAGSIKARALPQNLGTGDYQS